MKRQWKLGKILSVALLVAVVFSCLHASTASATNPATISFQGKVVNANGTNVTDGNYSFTFKLYTVSSAGTAVWGETQSSVAVSGGVFQVNLGSTCSFFTTQTCSGFSNTAIDFNASPALYLGITFNSDPQGEMTPRVQMQSVPYAFNSDKVGGFTASQLVQLSPGSTQSGFINLTGNSTIAGTLGGLTGLTVGSGTTALTGTVNINTSGSGTISLGGSSGTIGIGGASAGAITLQSSSTLTLTTTNFSVTSGGAVSAISTITGTTLNGTTGINTGATAGTQRIDNSGNLVNIGNLTATANLTITNAGAGNDITVTSQDQITLGTGANGLLVTSSSGATVASFTDGTNTLVKVIDANVSAVNYGILQIGAKSSAGNEGAQCTAAGDVGKIYVNSADKAVFACTAANAWEQLDNGRLNQIANAASYTVTTTDSIIGGADSLTITPSTANSDVEILYSATIAFTATGLGANPGTVTIRLVRGATCAGGTQIATYSATEAATANTQTVSYTAIDASPTNAASNTYIACARLSGGGGTIADTITNRSLILGEVDTTGADYAEVYYSASPTIGAGSVVVNDTSLKAGVKLSSSRYQKGTIGVVSTQPGQVVSDHSDSGNPVVVALAGRVPVKVSDENGPIRAGDLLTSSSTPGFAMRAAKSGIVIGTALTDFVGQGTGEVMMFVHTGQSAGSLPLGSDANPESSSMLLTDFTSGRIGTDQPVDLSSMFTDRLAAAVEIVTPKLVTDEVQTNTIVIGHDGINFKNGAGDVVASIDSSGVFHNKGSAITASPTGNATVKGNLAIIGGNSSDAKNLENALKIDNANSTLPIGAAISITNTGGGGFTNIISSPNFSVSGAGDVNAKNLHISLTADGTFTLLNPAGSQVATMNANGDATFAGNLNLNSASLSGGLNVGGDANFAGLSTFQKLATFIGKTVFRQDAQFDAHITVASDTAGYASLRIGETSVHVTFTHPYDNPPIVAASLTDGQFALSSVRNITKEGFDIALQTPALSATTFSWTALGANSPQTASNPVPATP